MIKVKIICIIQNIFESVLLIHYTYFNIIYSLWVKKEALKRGRCMILEISNPSAFNVSKGSIIFDKFHVSPQLIVLSRQELNDK